MSEVHWQMVGMSGGLFGHYTVLYCTILYYGLLYYTILEYTTLHYTTLYYTILSYTIQYYYYTIGLMGIQLGDMLVMEHM